MHVVATSALGSKLERALLARARAYKQNQTTLLGNLFGDLGGAAQMHNGLIEVDDVDAIALTVNVGLSRGTEKRGRMAEM